MKKTILLILTILITITLASAVLISNNQFGARVEQLTTTQIEVVTSEVTISYLDNNDTIRDKIEDSYYYQLADKLDMLNASLVSEGRLNITEVTPFNDGSYMVYWERIINVSYSKEIIILNQTKLNELKKWSFYLDIWSTGEVCHYCSLEDNRTCDCVIVSGSRCYHNEEKQGYNSCRAGMSYGEWIKI